MSSLFIKLTLLELYPILRVLKPTFSMKDEKNDCGTHERLKYKSEVAKLCISVNMMNEKSERSNEQGIKK